MKIRFACPGCERPALVKPGELTDWQCPDCDQRCRIPGTMDLTCCGICGNSELYKQKDFPHWLGMTILVVACLGFVVAHGLYYPWLAWYYLIGSAVFDGGLYLLVGDAIVCYRCGAHYHGLKAMEDHKPFELGIAERYRQERIRRQQIQLEAGGKEQAGGE